MKKSITISVAIILAVIVIALYKGAHQHLTAFDAMLFATIFFIGVMAGKAYSDHVHSEYVDKITDRDNKLLEMLKKDKELLIKQSGYPLPISCHSAMSNED